MARNVISNNGVKKIFNLIKNKFNQYLPLSGGFISGDLLVGGVVYTRDAKAKLHTDNEGGNLQLISSDNTAWEIDAYNGDLRIFTYANNVKVGVVINKQGKVSLPNGMDSVDIGKYNIGGNVIYSSTGIHLEANNGNNDVYTHSSGLRVYSAYTGSGYNARPCYASSFNQESSRRLKNNIYDMTEDEAKKILNINAVSFKYNNQKDDHINYGVIAEDVYEQIPYVVSGDIDSEDPMDIGVDYSKFVPYLIKMVQIQQKEIEELRSKK